MKNIVALALLAALLAAASAAAKPQKTYILLDAVKLGDTVIAFGRVYPPAKEVEVKVTYLVDGKQAAIHTVATDAAGRFNDSLQASGKIVVTATIKGASESIEAAPVELGGLGHLSPLGWLAVAIALSSIAVLTWSLSYTRQRRLERERLRRELEEEARQVGA